MNRRLQATLPPIVMAIFGLFLIWIIPQQIYDDSKELVGPRFFPYLVAYSIIILSIGSIITDFIIRKMKSFQQNKEEVATISKRYFNRVLIILLSSILWVVALPVVGFIIPTFLLMILLMIIIGNKNKLQILIVSLLFTALLYYTVNFILKLSFPEGLFF